MFRTTVTNGLLSIELLHVFRCYHEYACTCATRSESHLEALCPAARSEPSAPRLSMVTEIKMRVHRLKTGLRQQVTRVGGSGICRGKCGSHVTIKSCPRLQNTDGEEKIISYWISKPKCLADSTIRQMGTIQKQTLSYKAESV
jgi:hypothetical protein